MVARKGSIVEVAGNSTGVINKPHPLLLLCLTTSLVFVSKKYWVLKKWPAHPSDTAVATAAADLQSGVALDCEMYDVVTSSNKGVESSIK